MDPRPTQVASGAFGDWRAQLQRQRMVYKIMDTLKKNLPFYRYDRLQELKKIAQRVEHETFTAATCESEYSRKICFMMLAMETRLQNRIWFNPPFTLYNSVKPSVPLDSTANGGDWQEEVYQEITALKDLYLLDMIGQNPNGEDWQEEVYQKVAGGAVGDPTTESGDWRAQLAADSRERITYKILDTLKRHLPFSGDEGQEELKKIAVRFEEKIYTAATSQFDYLRKISLKMLTMETRS